MTDNKVNVGEAVRDLTGSEKFLKWGAAAAIIGFLGVTFLPGALSLVKGTIEMVILGIVLLALIYFIPVITEFLASAAYRSWATAVKADPLSRLKRDYNASAIELDNAEKAIAETETGIIQFETQINKNKAKMPEYKIEEWKSKLAMLRENLQLMIDARDHSAQDLKEAKVLIEAAEIDYSLAQTFSEQIKAGANFKTSGTKSGGYELAMKEINDKITSSSTQLRTALKRKKTEAELNAA